MDDVIIFNSIDQNILETYLNKNKIYNKDLIKEIDFEHDGLKNIKKIVTKVGT